MALCLSNSIMCILSSLQVLQCLPLLVLVLGSEEATCGGVHCFGSSVYCCTDNFGVQSCCYKSLYEESWFWALLGIGVLLTTAVLLYVCRALYRYHNAGQYTKLRLQQPDDYGAVSGVVPRVSLSPSQDTTINQEDPGQLPSYSSVMGMPPGYNEMDNER